MLEVNLVKNLWHFNLELKLKAANEIVVLLGPSGSGKTTVLQCLAGLLKPSAGSIKIDDKLVFSAEQNINVPTRHRDIGYLFQDYALFPHLTVKDNVLYGPKSRRAGTDLELNPVELLDSFGVGHLLNRYPRQLSGGEKQRVALARALATRPKLLLLDEPLSALDRNTRLSLRQELKNLHKSWQVPFVLVTHDEEEAEYLGDQLIVIEKGRVQEIAVSHVVGK
ncbi:ABC transporter ATP-binding protein [Desulfotomaculum sp. 1211_IL3151]|uniref:ABC transporter ATP-binding protein n=1 Tax=Desulfotomaculum sp. 1211_IL3151 TaxID=3084055 RepID=UPI002FD9761B